MKKIEIRINKDSFTAAVTQAVKEMEGMSSGWGKPIFLDDDGACTVGNIISQGTWQPGSTELCRVMAWSVEEVNGEEFQDAEDRAHAVEYYLDEFIGQGYREKAEETILGMNYITPDGGVQHFPEWV